MLVATISLTQNKLGSAVILYGVTPLEAAMLTAEHHQNVGKEPVTLLSEPVDEDRGELEEMQRLIARYGDNLVQATLRANMNKLPKDYKEATKVGFHTKRPNKTMSEIPDFKV